MPDESSRLFKLYIAPPKSRNAAIVGRAARRIDPPDDPPIVIDSVRITPAKTKCAEIGHNTIAIEKRSWSGGADNLVEVIDSVSETAALPVQLSEVGHRSIAVAKSVSDV